jgi:hypothetical protein
MGSSIGFYEEHVLSRVWRFYQSIDREQSTRDNVMSGYPTYEPSDNHDATDPHGAGRTKPIKRKSRIP